MEDRKAAAMITKRTNDSGLTFLDIETPLCTASICLQGAHLTSWKPAGEEECLFMSPAAVFEPGKAIRGGIPICWPWFGAKEGKPSHGIARITEWDLRQQSEDEKGNVHLSLALYPTSPEHPAAYLRITLGRTLIMKLETTVRSKPCKLTEAFHNYFTVGNLTKCRVLGLDDAAFKEHVNPPIKHGERPLAPCGALDRIYTCPKTTGKITLEDPVLNRAIIIERQSAASSIVWNPGQQGAAAMADLGKESWNKFLCIETGNAAPKVIALAPGQGHVLTQKISIAKLK